MADPKKIPTFIIPQFEGHYSEKDFRLYYNIANYIQVLNSYQLLQLVPETGWQTAAMENQRQNMSVLASST